MGFIVDLLWLCTLRDRKSFWLRKRFSFRFERCLLESVQHKAGCIVGGQLLMHIFVLSLISIGPITDGFDQNPIYMSILAGYIQPCAFHIAANGFQLKLL